MNKVKVIIEKGWEYGFMKCYICDSSPRKKHHLHKVINYFIIDKNSYRDKDNIYLCDDCINKLIDKYKDMIQDNRDHKKVRLNKVIMGPKFTYNIGPYLNTKHFWICAECGLAWFSREQARLCAYRGHIPEYQGVLYIQRAEFRVDLKNLNKNIKDQDYGLIKDFRKLEDLI